MDQEVAERDACRIEHVISGETFKPHQGARARRRRLSGNQSGPRRVQGSASIGGDEWP